MLLFICSTNQRESQAMITTSAPLRIIFAGTPEFACASLTTLIQSPHEVVAVLTQADQPHGRGLKSTASPVKQLAEKHGLTVLTPSKLNQPALQAQLASYTPDLMVVVAYGKLLPLRVLNLPHYGCLNIHASLLPRWRGASPIQQAILQGDTESGVTIMQMTQGLDEGPMLAQAAIMLAPTETAQSLHDRLAALGSKLLINVLTSLPEKLAQAVPQPTQGITYAPKIAKTNGLIDWHLSAAQIDQQIRAFTPWPTAYTFINQMLVKIHTANPSTHHTTAQPGTLVAYTEQGLVIQTGLGCLELLSVQLPGKKRMLMKEACNGHQTLFQLGAVCGK